MLLSAGKGVLDGRADFENWWSRPKDKIRAWRPRMIFLNHCENINCCRCYSTKFTGMESASIFFKSDSILRYGSKGTGKFS